MSALLTALSGDEGGGRRRRRRCRRSLRQREHFRPKVLRHVEAAKVFDVLLLAEVFEMGKELGGVVVVGSADGIFVQPGSGLGSKN